MLVKPKRIFGIVDTFNNKSIVPSYLYEHCVGAKDNVMRKQANKLRYICYYSIYIHILINISFKSKH